MVIDATGKWWKGSEPKDLKEYLEALSADQYPIDIFTLRKCECGSDAFQIEVDDDEGCAKTTCSKCRQPSFLADSEEYWSSDSPRTYKCIECSLDRANVGLGFALTTDRNCIQWVYIGCRCSACGVLGCMIDWKIGYEPSLHFAQNA